MSFWKMPPQHWLWTLGGLVLVGVAMTGGAVKDYLKRAHEHRLLSKKIEAAETRLQKKQDRLLRAQSDDAFLEQEARLDLGLVRADEIEFRFVPGKAGQEESIEQHGPADDLQQSPR